MSVSTFTSAGAKATVATKVSKDIFEIEVTNHELIKSAYVAYLANGRENLAKTKTRAMVSGGGKKPWRQKGTGRARFGSSRVPIWRKGGVAMGPTGNENYSHAISTGDKRRALAQGLSLKQKAGIVSVIEEFSSKDGKTKSASALMEKLGANRNVLLVNHATDAVFERSIKNLDFVKLVRTRALNIFDVMNADSIIFTKEAIEELTVWLGGKS